MSHYWHLIKWDGEVIKVKPENVEFVQAKLDTSEGFIKTPNRSIAVKDIKDFVESDEIFTDHKLLEGASKAFNDPVINDSDDVVCRWVKKSVPKRQYTRYYMHFPAYRRLREDDSYVTIAWKQPVHQINNQLTDELTQEDELNMSTRV